MTTVYPSDTRRCALCDKSSAKAKVLGLYVVGTRAAIGYTLCKCCGKLARRGLPPDLLRKLDAKMEAEAKLLGLTETH
ncbi:MAG: hypothetical protein KGO01_05650 [Burkholderiales bacterium]|nr:hypothetical protein [Burkholderiales bacterium]